MRSPSFAILWAMLWENWRVTRVECAWRLALGIVGGLAVLVVFAAVAPNQATKDFGAVIAMILLVLPHFLNWVSFFNLNGWRPGFPLYHLYTRPVRTAVIVGLPMAYLTARAGGDIPGICTPTEGDLRLSVPAAARRRVDCGPQPGHAGDQLVDPQHGRHDAGKYGCQLGLDPFCRLSSELLCERLRLARLPDVCGRRYSTSLSPTTY